MEKRSDGVYQVEGLFGTVADEWLSDGRDSGRGGHFDSNDNID